MNTKLERKIILWALRIYSDASWNDAPKIFFGTVPPEKVKKIILSGESIFCKDLFSKDKQKTSTKRFSLHGKRAKFCMQIYLLKKPIKGKIRGVYWRSLISTGHLQSIVAFHMSSRPLKLLSAETISAVCIEKLDWKWSGFQRRVFSVFPGFFLNIFLQKKTERVRKLQWRKNGFWRTEICLF